MCSSDLAAGEDGFALAQALDDHLAGRFNGGQLRSEGIEAALEGIVILLDEGHMV